MPQKSFVIFGGLNTRDDASLLDGESPDCTNVELRSGKIQGLLGDTLVNTVLGDEPYEHILFDFSPYLKEIQPDVYAAVDVIKWPISSVELYHYSLPDSSNSREFWTTQTFVSADTHKLGLPVPQITTEPAGSGSASMTGTFQYAITFQRTVGSYVSESGPVLSASVTVANVAQVDIVMTEADTALDPDYYGAIGNMKFNLYRLFNGEYRLVGSTAVNTTTANTTTISDVDTANASLTTVLPTYFQSRRTGNVVGYGDTPTINSSTISGMSQQPYGGLLFIWTEETLYWCDTIKPYAWPSDFSTNFGGVVRDVLITNSAAYVVTSIGVYKTVSTDPEAMEFRLIFSNPNIYGWRGTAHNNSIYFLAEDGIYSIYGDSPELLTANLDKSTLTITADSSYRPVTMRVFENKLFVSIVTTFWTAATNLVYDFLSKKWTKWADSDTFYKSLRITRYFSYGAILYGTRVDRTSSSFIATIPATYVVHDDVNTPTTAWDWKSAELLGDSVFSGGFAKIEVQGSGTVTLETFVDGVSQNSKALSFSTRGDRTLGLPTTKYARTVQFKLSSSGGGVVKEVTLVGGRDG